jgi:hypothetical protein
VAIFEFEHPARYEEYWWREDQPDLYDNLPRAPRPYTPVTQK